MACATVVPHPVVTAPVTFAFGGNVIRTVVSAVIGPDVAEPVGA